MICLAAVDDDAIRSAMTLKSPSHEASGCRQVTDFAEEELDHLAHTVDGPIEVHPPAPDLDGLIDMPLAGDRPLPPIEPFQQQGRVAEDPGVYRGMIDADAALGHHFFQIAKAEIVGKVPTHAERDHRTIEMMEHSRSRLASMHPSSLTSSLPAAKALRSVAKRGRRSSPFAISRPFPLLASALRD